MSKNRFYDSRLSYLSFVQNTDEKKVISDKIYPYLSNLPDRDVYHFLDAGIGDGTITSNIFYIAQLSKEESELLQYNTTKINKIKKAILNQDTLYFNNEIFSIKKI